MEQERRERLKEKILQELRMTEELKDDEVGQVIDRVILEESEQEYIPLSEKLELRRALFHSIRGLDVLSDFLEDPSITEIMVNGTDPIFVERDGRLIRTDKAFESEDRLLNVINQMVSQANRSVSETCPIADAILNDGSRLNVVLSTISRGGHAVTVRKRSCC